MADDPATARVKEWLGSIGLDSYLSAFVDQGFEQLDDLVILAESGRAGQDEMIAICNEAMPGGALAKLKSQHRLRNALTKLSLLAVEATTPLPPATPLPEDAESVEPKSGLDPAGEGHRRSSLVMTPQQSTEETVDASSMVSAETGQPSQKAADRLSAALAQLMGSKEAAETAVEKAMEKKTASLREDVENIAPKMEALKEESTAEALQEEKKAANLERMRRLSLDPLKPIDDLPRQVIEYFAENEYIEGPPAIPPPPVVSIDPHVRRANCDPLGMEWDTASGLTELCGTPVGIDDFEPSSFIFTERERQSIRRRREKIAPRDTSTPMAKSRLSVAAGTQDAVPSARRDPDTDEVGAKKSAPPERGIVSNMGATKTKLAQSRRSSNGTPLPPSPDSGSASEVDVDGEYDNVNDYAEYGDDEYVQIKSAELPRRRARRGSNASVLSISSVASAPTWSSRHGEEEPSSPRGPRRSETGRKKRFAPSRRSQRPKYDEARPKYNYESDENVNEQKIATAVPRRRRKSAGNYLESGVPPLARPISMLPQVPKLVLTPSVSTSAVGKNPVTVARKPATGGKSWVMHPNESIPADMGRVTWVVAPQVPVNVRPRRKKKASADTATLVEMKRELLKAKAALDNVTAIRMSRSFCID